MSLAPPGPARPSTPARKAERAAKRRLAHALAALVRPRPATPADVSALRVERLLVIRQHNQMGDMVCALPALRALRRAWPAAKLTFVAGPLAEELLQNHPDLDELIVFRKRDMWRPWKLVRLLARLRHPRPDLAVVMTTVSFSTTSALLAWMSGARLRCGGSSTPFGSDLSSAIYHLELPVSCEAVSEVEHNLASLRVLGIAATAVRPSLVASPEGIDAARRFLEREVPGAGPVVIAHVGAGKIPNIWPAEHFITVLNILQAEYGARVVLTEGPGDAAPVRAVVAGTKGATCWRARLGDTFGLLAVARLALCNDTGLAHVAAAVGTSTIVLFGPTDPIRWKPSGEHVHVVRAASGRIADVDPRAVLEIARALLDSGYKRTAANPPP